MHVREMSRTWPEEMQLIALRKLRMINNAQHIKDLRIPPANKLEKLGGGRAALHGMRINDQWRICFLWRDGDAYNVEITRCRRGEGI